MHRSFATGDQRKLAMERFAVLQPHLEHDVPLTSAARHGGISIRTAEQGGLAGLVRATRSDADAHRLSTDLVAVIEGWGLKKPRTSAAAIHRRIGNMAKAEGWPVPSYSTVYAILANLDPAMVTLAHDGDPPFAIVTNWYTGTGRRRPMRSGKPITPRSIC